MAGKKYCIIESLPEGEKEKAVLTAALTVLIMQQEGGDHLACTALACDLESAAGAVRYGYSGSYKQTILVVDDQAIVDTAFLAHKDEDPHTVAHAMRLMEESSKVPRTGEPSFEMGKDEPEWFPLFAAVLFLDLYFEMDEYRQRRDGAPSSAWLFRRWDSDSDPERSSFFWTCYSSTPTLQEAILSDFTARFAESASVERSFVATYESWERLAAGPRYREEEHPACNALAQDLKTAALKIPNDADDLRGGLISHYLVIKDLKLSQKTVDRAFLEHREDSQHTVGHALTIVQAGSDWRRSAASDDGWERADSLHLRELYAAVLFLDLYYQMEEYALVGLSHRPLSGWLVRQWNEKDDPLRESYFWQQIDAQPRLRLKIREIGDRNGPVVRDLSAIHLSWKDRAARPRYYKPRS